MIDTINEILKGSYDLHVHAAPDANAERRMDALSVARAAYEAELGGFVLKSHDYPTAPLTYALEQMYPGLTVAGAIALNKAVGGVNPDAVQVAAKLGSRVVWMPTFTADFWMQTRGGGEGLRLTDESGNLIPEVFNVLDIINEYDMVLASGHVSPAEALLLFREAKARGVTRMIATHPGETASINEQREMIALGAYPEYTFLSCMPARMAMTPAELVERLRTLGVDNCIVTTDFGQWMNPPPAEGMRMAIATLLDAGMDAIEVEKLVKTNPAAILVS